MFPRIIFVSTAILFLLSVAACSPNTEQLPPTSEIDPTETEKSTNDENLESTPPMETVEPTATTSAYPQAVDEVVKMYRAASSFSPLQVEVVSYELAEWDDSCLGLAFPEEICAGVNTQGWVIVLRASPGGEAVFHDDLSGEKIRRAPEDEQPSDENLVHPTATRTGIEEVDVVLQAILSNQVDARRELVHFTELGCTTADGLGGPPKCENGEQDGTLVEVLPILGGEGHHTRRDSIDRTLSFNIAGLFAIYRVPEDAWQDESYPAGDYGLVYILLDNPFPMTVHVKDGGIVRLDYHTGITPLEVIEQRGGELILPPFSGRGSFTPTP